MRIGYTKNYAHRLKTFLKDYRHHKSRENKQGDSKLKDSYSNINISVNTGSSILIGADNPIPDPYYAGFWVRFTDGINEFINILNSKLCLSCIRMYHGIQEYGIHPNSVAAAIAAAIQEEKDENTLAAILMHYFDNARRTI